MQPLKFHRPMPKNVTNLATLYVFEIKGEVFWVLGNNNKVNFKVENDLLHRGNKFTLYTVF